jgi:polyhydroxybutyrate depolymerase
VPVWIDEVAARNGCSEETEVVYQKGDVTCIAYEDCEDGATVKHCSIDGGGHNWPGAADLCALFPEYCPWAGYTTDDIDASRAIWKFFAEHAICDDDCECDDD